jgi:uncharacterized cofD-like protein
MRVVGIGGGTGLPVLLSGLKKLDENGEEPVDITAIVTVSDDGGSTGALRGAFGMPAMGDIRNCLVALANPDKLLTLVCQHRFEVTDGLAGHSLGNLILSALYQMSGDFLSAVQLASDLLGVKGQVLPVTEIPVTLCALRQDGTTIEGESAIPQSPGKLSRLWLDPPDPLPAPGVLNALKYADAIVLGPGSLYTSIIPNLLVEGVAEAIYASRAIKIYVCNLMTQAGETDGYSAADHLRALDSYLPEGSIDACILNNQSIGMGLAERYQRSDAETVWFTPENEDDIRRAGVIPVAAALLKDGEVKARHDPEALARVVVSLACGVTGMQELTCGQRNGR